MSIFDSIPKPKVPRSRKKMPHYNLFTTDYGKLVPFFFMDCVPHDKIKLRSEVFINTAPMITAPYIENDVRCDYFFVPYRLLWKNWEKFITGGVDGMENPNILTVNGANLANANEYFTQAGSLWDFFGLPTNEVVDAALLTNDCSVNAFPFLAYLKIWQEYYRDQNWQTDLQTDLDYIHELDGDISEDLIALYYTLMEDGLSDNKWLLSRGWRKDYFTAALPTPQRGPEVPINFDSSVKIPVEIMEGVNWTKLTTGLRAKQGDDYTTPLEWAPVGAKDIVVNTSSGVYLRVNADGDIKQVSQTEVSGGGLHVLSMDDVHDVYAPLAEWLSNMVTDKPGTMYISGENLPAITINDLRRANAIQVFLERNMRAGSRYVEQILSHFGVRVPDYRLDRPEYIGGFSQPIVVNQVMQNSQTTLGEGGSALGSYAGKGRSAAPGKKLSYKIEEHGCIIGLMSVMPKAVYSGGVPRQFTRKSRYDFYFPEFANLGEQEVRSNELLFTGSDSAFGYVPRYSEYQWIPNQVHGDFLKPGMRQFTQYREFTPGMPPSNGNEFLAVHPDSDGINRIWAVEDDGDFDHFWVTVFNHVNAKRPMPRWGVPKLKA